MLYPANCPLHVGVSPALAQLVILSLEHVQLLGKANDDHEEQEHHESGGPDGDAHYLELRDDRLAAGTLVPHVVLDVAPARQIKRYICKAFSNKLVTHLYFYKQILMQWSKVNSIYNK